MTQDFILQTALRQSAIDCGCAPEDFLKSENVVVKSTAHPDARRYLSLPFECNLVSYGNNIVASVSENCREITEEYISRFEFAHCFETPNMHVFEKALEEKGLKICFMAEYFLPEIEHLHRRKCGYETKILVPEDFTELYTEQWSNALCEKRKHLDVLGVGAYENGKLIGLAGCSADCDGMWQIGIDVLPEYRRQGIASALTANLACEIIERGKVPFYCAAWSNIRSVRNAIKSGFCPAWVELTTKKAEFVDEMNGEKKRMKLVYATGNPAKLDAMRHRLEPLGIELVGMKELGLPVPEVEENGTTPLENAEKKAMAYYKAFGMPVFSCDSGLYIDEVPEAEQPGVHVRTVGGKYLSDDEMIEYYSAFAKKYGKVTARYKNAICLVLDSEHIYSAMEKSMESTPFIIAEKPHSSIRKAGFPIDSLSIDVKTGKYFYDLEPHELEKVAVEDGFLDFFRATLDL